MKTLSLNRVVALLTAAGGLIAAIAVPVANMDTSSTLGVLGGLAAITVAAAVWLRGWQLHERTLVELGVTPAGDGVIADPALDDPNFEDDEPIITAEALAGRSHGSARLGDHTNLGDR